VPSRQYAVTSTFENENTVFVDGVFEHSHQLKDDSSEAFSYDHFETSGYRASAPKQWPQRAS
jgi:hypothetical protein